MRIASKKGMIKITIKERLTSIVNGVVSLDDYVAEDCIFSQKYQISPADMVYILLKLAKEFKFTITDDFVDALENCTFAKLENLLEQYEGTATA